MKCFVLETGAKFYFDCNSAYEVNEKESLITVKRYHPTIREEVSLRFENGFNYQEWEHFCFVFQSFAQVPYPGGDMNLTIKAYYNGEFIREGTVLDKQ